MAVDAPFNTCECERGAMRVTLCANCSDMDDCVACSGYFENVMVHFFE